MQHGALLPDLDELLRITEFDMDDSWIPALLDHQQPEQPQPQPQQSPAVVLDSTEAFPGHSPEFRTSSPTLRDSDFGASCSNTTATLLASLSRSLAPSQVLDKKAAIESSPESVSLLGCLELSMQSMLKSKSNGLQTSHLGKRGVEDDNTSTAQQSKRVRLLEEVSPLNVEVFYRGSTLAEVQREYPYHFKQSLLCSWGRYTKDQLKFVLEQPLRLQSLYALLTKLIKEEEISNFVRKCSEILSSKGQQSELSQTMSLSQAQLSCGTNGLDSSDILKQKLKRLKNSEKSYIANAFSSPTSAVLLFSVTYNDGMIDVTLHSNRLAQKIFCYTNSELNDILRSSMKSDRRSPGIPWLFFNEESWIKFALNNMDMIFAEHNHKGMFPDIEVFDRWGRSVRCDVFTYVLEHYSLQAYEIIPLESLPSAYPGL